MNDSINMIYNYSQLYIILDNITPILMGYFSYGSKHWKMGYNSDYGILIFIVPIKVRINDLYHGYDMG